MSGRVSVNIVTTWQQALEAVDHNRLTEANNLFWNIRDFSAKIWFNLSIIDLLRDDLTAADEKLKECVKRDEYLAVAHFQRGVLACFQGRLIEAKESFLQAERNVLSGDSIDYRQLGLALRLTLEQIAHNQATVQAQLTRLKSDAKISAAELEVLPTCLFRPGRSLVDNVEKRNFLPRSKIISAVPHTVVQGETSVAGIQSAPTSPASHRRLEVKANSHKPRTPPPSRPPPRLPPPSTSVTLPADSHCHGNKHSQGRHEEGDGGKCDQQSANRSGKRSDNRSDRLVSLAPHHPAPQVKGVAPRQPSPCTATPLAWCRCKGQNSSCEAGAEVSSGGNRECGVCGADDTMLANRHTATLSPSVAGRVCHVRPRSVQDLAGREDRGDGEKAVGHVVGHSREVRGRSDRSCSQNGNNTNVAKQKPPRPPPPKLV